MNPDALGDCHVRSMDEYSGLARSQAIIYFWLIQPVSLRDAGRQYLSYLRLQSLKASDLPTKKK